MSTACKAAFALILGISAWSFLMAAEAAQTESECLKLGFSESKTTVTLDRYCIRRAFYVVVVPLDQARLGSDTDGRAGR